MPTPQNHQANSKWFVPPGAREHIPTGRYVTGQLKARARDTGHSPGGGNARSSRVSWNRECTRPYWQICIRGYLAPCRRPIPGPPAREGVEVLSRRAVHGAVAAMPSVGLQPHGLGRPETQIAVEDECAAC